MIRVRDVMHNISVTNACASYRAYVHDLSTTVTHGSEAFRVFYPNTGAFGREFGQLRSTSSATVAAVGQVIFTYFYFTNLHVVLIAS